jgi:hypothetical protein
MTHDQPLRQQDLLDTERTNSNRAIFGSRPGFIRLVHRSSLTILTGHPFVNSEGEIEDQRPIFAVIFTHFQPFSAPL